MGFKEIKALLTWVHKTKTAMEAIRSNTDKSELKLILFILVLL